MIRGVLLDLGGVVYEGEHKLPGATEAVARLHQAGLPLRFITNTTRKTKQALLKRLTGFGLEITESELFTPAQAAKTWLAENDSSPSLLVHPNLVSEFAGIPTRAKRAVVVGDAGEAFTYDHLNGAFRELVDGARLIALAKNRSFKDDDGELSMDAGAFVTALEYSSGQQALVLGKPAPAFFAATLASMNCAPDQAVMVGDDAEADVAGALRAELGQAILVRTGKYREGDETRFEPQPTKTVADLSAAADWIIANRG